MNDRSLPEPAAIRRSEGILVGVLGDQLVACDIVTHQAHIVDGLLAWLLLLNDSAPFGELVADVVAMTGASEKTATDDLREVVGSGTSLQLLGRLATAPKLPRTPSSRPTNNARYQTLTYPVLEDAVAFCSSDRTLIAQIDQVLDFSTTNVVPTQWISVSERQSGEVVMDGAVSLRFDTRHSFLLSLVDVLNRVAVRSQRAVAITAGAVRTPTGEVWLLPGGSGSDNRTLIGALIQAGCDHLGSDIIGIRDGTNGAVGYPTPLRLDTDSRALLGLGPSDSVFTRVSELRDSAQLLHGEHAPIGRVLFCKLAPDQPASAVRLDPAGAIEPMLACAVNLADAPPSGVQTLCCLAAGPPSLRIRYHDPVALARVLVGNESWESLDDLDRRIRLQRRLHLPSAASQETCSWDQLKVRRSSEVVFHDVSIDGEQTTFVIDRTGQTAWALTGLARRIWSSAADGRHPLIELIRSEADNLGGSDEHSSRAVARVLGPMIEQGLLLQDGAGVRPSLDIAAEDASPHDTVPELRRSGQAQVMTTPVDPRERWNDLSSDGQAIDWLGHRMVTDVESIRRTLVNIRDAQSVVGGSPDEVSGALIEVRSAPCPQGTVLIRLNGRRLWWVSEEAGSAVLGVILANLAADHASYAQPLGEISTILRRDHCLLHVGALTAADQSAADEVPLGSTAPLFGARVEHGKRVLLPDSARTVSWLANGANPHEVANIWSPYTLAGVLVEGARDLVGGWLRALTELSPWQPADDRFLSELMANGNVPLAIVPAGEAPFVVARTLLVRDEEWEQPRAITATTGRSERTSDDAISPTAVLQSAAWSWATRLGEASWSSESAKISRDRLVLGRGLLRIRFNSPTEDDDNPSAVTLVETVTNAITDLGLDLETATEIAQASVGAGNLYLGTELAGPYVRRKLYVSGILDSAWAATSNRWPRVLTEAGSTPSWIAWKWTEDRPDELERSTYQSHLGHAASVGQQVDPILDVMGTDWSDIIRHVLARLGVGSSAVPNEDDLLTLDEGGRRSVDLAGVGSGWRRWHDLEPEVRWLAAVAALGSEASDDLVAWSRGSRLSRLIFGTDQNHEPFVNLYVAKAQQQ